jgi:hypothetical protein
VKQSLIASLFAAFMFVSASAFAQSATVTFDYTVTPLPTAAVVQGWTFTLTVNSTKFVLNDTCVLNSAGPIVVTCTATLPNITTALTGSGPQSFTGTLADGILESSASLPLVLTRPSAPTAPRIQ